jgi:DNA repair protein RecO (recombination protein O)
MSLYKTPGINIGQITKTGEADKIICVFTPEYGKIKVLAKGARRTTSKFGGRLEILAHNFYLLARGKNFSILSQIETIDNFAALRREYRLLQTGLYLAKLTDLFTDDGIPDPPLYNLLFQSLRLLNSGVLPQVLTMVFEIKLLLVEGIYPNLEKCVECSKKLGSRPKKINFNLSGGGIICSECSRKNTGNFEVDYSVVRLLDKIRRIRKKDLPGFQVDGRQLKFMDSFLSSYISRHLDQDIGKWKNHDVH